MGERLYLPITYYNCYYHCTPQRKSELRTYLGGLQRGYTYFTVLQNSKGLEFLGINVPPGLDLMVFACGGTTRAVRSVPIPLLMEVRSRPA